MIINLKALAIDMEYYKLYPYYVQVCNITVFMNLCSVTYIREQGTYPNTQSTNQ